MYILTTYQDVTRCDVNTVAGSLQLTQLSQKFYLTIAGGALKLNVCKLSYIIQYRYYCMFSLYVSGVFLRIFEVNIVISKHFHCRNLGIILQGYI